MKQLGISDVFKPGWNTKTIPYIDDILTSKYNTKFMHAENGGEFKVYDPIYKQFYYADAYSKELNLWIEFDEEKKFNSKNELVPKIPFRETRIKEILECSLLRIKVDAQI